MIVTSLLSLNSSSQNSLSTAVVFGTLINDETPGVSESPYNKLQVFLWKTINICLLQVEDVCHTSEGIFKGKSQGK